MNRTPWTDEDVARAKAAWRAYQDTHDVSAYTGQAVGIDPISGRVWFGDGAGDTARAAAADGVTTSLLNLRVGYDYYQKGGRR